jgi:O-antigen ligase
VQVAVDLGVTGLCCFAAMHVVLLRKWHRVGRTVRNPHTKGQANALFWTLLIVEFFSLFNSVLYLKPLWILFGMVSGGLVLGDTYEKARMAGAEVAADEQQFPARLAAITDATTCPRLIE